FNEVHWKPLGFPPELAFCVAHNGVVAGSSPAGPTKCINQSCARRLPQYRRAEDHLSPVLDRRRSLSRSPSRDPPLVPSRRATLTSIIALDTLGKFWNVPQEP